MSNPHEVLGIKHGASSEEIKRAYRKLSLQHHPDKNGESKESTEMFQKITDAYEQLTNPQQRQQFHNVPKSFGGPGFGPIEVTAEELMRMLATGGFQNIFNHPGMQARMQRPMPIIKHLSITMQQSFTGCSLPLDVERWIMEGDIKKLESETIYVNIPEGIDSNEILICRNKGNVIDPNNIGDVKVFIKVSQEPGFERRGLDLVYNREITLKQALCGFAFDLKHLSGKSYRINNNRGNVVSLSSRKTINGLGFTRDGHVGSLIIEFNVAMPNKLTEEQIVQIEKIL